jgi:type IV secretion system protein VirB3
VADETAEIEVTPLVKALTRTPTLFGVPYMFSMFNMVVTAVVFLVTKNLLSGFLILPIHAAGYVLTLRDDRIFEIIRVKMTKCPPRSKALWGLDSYRP